MQAIAIPNCTQRVAGDAVPAVVVVVVVVAVTKTLPECRT
jgi:hypothetical protein